MAGYRGTFVISWMQTYVDALSGAPVSAIAVGSTWRWTGKAVRIDAPRDVLVLNGADGLEELHRRAATVVPRLLGRSKGGVRDTAPHDYDESLFEDGFDVTDGNRQYRISLIQVEELAKPLLLFVGEAPPADTDLWVVHAMTAPCLAAEYADARKGTICFTPGTRIATEEGSCLVEDLQEGDRILTRDSGAQPLLWIGRREITGARLRALPHLRPVRLRANVLGQDEPDADLLVSPDHHILLKGPMAATLFNTDEVLVAARDLVNDGTIAVDHTLRSVTYIHLMLPSHQILWANGIETESFNPARAVLDAIDGNQLGRLYDCMPDLKRDPTAYGMPARRALSQSEAALLHYCST